MWINHRLFSSVGCAALDLKLLRSFKKKITAQNA